MARRGTIPRANSFFVMNNDHDNESVRLTTEEARQGESSGHMRYVLGFGIAGAAICLTLLVAYWQA